MTWSSGGVVRKSSIRKLPNIEASNTKSLCDEGSFIFFFFPSVELAGDENKKKCRINLKKNHDKAMNFQILSRLGMVT